MIKEPKYSCSYLDKAISAAHIAANEVKDEIEKARNIHEELREWGGEREAQAKSLERELSKLTDEYDKLDRTYEAERKENKELRFQIDQLERDLTQSRDELKEYSNHRTGVC